MWRRIAMLPSDCLLGSMLLSCVQPPVIRKAHYAFFSEHAFFIAAAATATKALFTLRADCGHTATQRIQEMHFFPSVSLGLSLLIACAGHFSAQRPHALHL